MATQNPIEQEGTYPLPEAQLDRFLMHVAVGYPDEQSEEAIVRLNRDEESGTPGTGAPSASVASGDQLAFAIGCKHRGLDNPRSAKFPFGPTKADMRNNLNGGCKDLPPEIRDLFVVFEPYKGGNNNLWAMNELCNAPKHKMIYPIEIGRGRVGLGGSFSVGSGGLLVQSPVWDSEKNELIFARFPDGAIHGNPNFNVGFDLTFGDVDEVIRDQKPIDALRAMVGEVERVLTATERECRRIGLIS